jgi:hypothetical protein
MKKWLKETWAVSVFFSLSALASPVFACQCCYHNGFPGVCYPTLPCSDRCKFDLKLSEAEAEQIKKNDATFLEVQQLLRDRGLDYDVAKITVKSKPSPASAAKVPAK